MKADVVYKDLLEHVLYNGVPKGDRTGTGTYSTFGNTIKFDLREGFPLLTTKKMPIKSIIHELLWFLNGDTNIKYLADNKVSIWDEWAYERYLKYCSKMEEPDVELLVDDLEEGRLRPMTQAEYVIAIKEDYVLHLWPNKPMFSEVFGALGPIYGKQWRDFNGVDQIKELIQSLNTKPDDRRMIVSAWNPGEINQMALPPCHALWQIYTEKMSLFERKKLWCDAVGKSIYYAEDFDHIDLDKRGAPSRYISMLWYQRSVDVPLGLPFNIASYAALLMILGQQVNMVPKELTGMLGDTHVYSNQIDGVRKHLWNDPHKYQSPKLEIRKADDIFSYTIEDFKLTGYESFPKISMPVAV